MNLRIDWKFWIALVATLAGVVVPVWLWRADLEARSLHFKMLSQTSLHPLDAPKTLDLKVSAAGIELPTPYLTVFELINNGEKPVPSADFETPIEIVATNKARIVRTSVTKASPEDLVPSISTEEAAVKIKPLLFNPGDSLTIAILTSGDQPAFVSRARIAGIRSVPIVDEREKITPRWVVAVSAVVMLMALAAAGVVVDGWPSAGVHLRPRSAFLTFVVAMILAAFAAVIGFDSMGVKGVWPVILTMALAVGLMSYFAAWWNRKQP